MRSVGRRGSSALMAMVVILSLSTLILVGLDARDAERGYQDRSLCRLQARWAAESGLALAEQRILRGIRSGSAHGTLEEASLPVRYDVQFRPLGVVVEVLAKGSCRDADQASDVTITVQVEAKRGRLHRRRWLETGG